MMLVDKKTPSMQPTYANEYQGEWVNYQLGSRTDRKFVQPRNDFWRPQGRAIVLGNGTSRQRFNLKQFNQSNAHKKLMHYNIIYGCNKAYVEDGELDFLVITHRFLDKHLARSMHGITYSIPEVQRKHKAMNLIPVHYRMDAGTTAAMLAAFHGAKEVFLFGFDGQDTMGRNNNIYAGTEFYSPAVADIKDSQWHADMMSVMSAYQGTMFYRVDTMPPGARAHLSLPNHKVITFNQFVSLADL